MACGSAEEVLERYWAICHKDFNYPCGIKWCKKWGIPYPCGLKYCKGSLPYPCRKTRRKTKYCYDFSVVHESCKVFYAKLYGCCDGKEYEWSSACFGWFGSYHTNKRICFDNPPKEVGKCKEGNSLPPGGEIPGGPIDPGSVAPHPNDSVR